MLIEAIQRFETNFFSGLNQFVEPLVRVGLGGPLLFPAGAIVIETRGRKTGRLSSIPLMAAIVGDLVVVSTLRGRSNWMKNLAANPEIRFWINGRERAATCFTIGPEMETPVSMPEKIRCLARTLEQNSSIFGTRFAILMPHPSSTSRAA